MKYKVFPNLLKGSFNALPSKSYSHRALICASLTNDKSRISNFLYCDDTISTINCLKALNVKIECIENEVFVTGNKELKIIDRLDAHDSASTIRMLIPLISLFENEYDFYGSKRLIKRINTKDLDSLGLEIKVKKDHLHIKGSLNISLLKSNITSQWISGILFCLPITKEKIYVDNKSNPYNKMTIAMQKEFGVIIDDDFNYIEGNYIAKNITIDSDYTNLSNFLVMNYLGNEIEIKNIKSDLIQGDKTIIDLLNRLKEEDNPIFIMDNNPDLVMILAFACSLTRKVSIIKGIERLKMKESNRILSTFRTLKKLGADIKLKNNQFIIKGKDYLDGGRKLSSYNDHRLVLALVAISSRLKKPIIINKSEVINKSSLEFMKIFSNIGGKYESKL